MEDEELTVEEATQLRKELEESKTKVDELEKEKGTKSEEYETAKTEWQKKEEDLESQINPNWKKTRETMDTLRKAAEAKGIKFDTDGNIVENPQNVNVEELLQKAEEKGKSAARGELLGGKFEEMLEEYDEESGKLIKHAYDKLATDENITLKSLPKLFSQAVKVAELEVGADIKKTDAAIQHGGTGMPRETTEGKLEEAQADELAEKMSIKIKDDKK